MAGLPDVNKEYVAWAAPTCPLGTAATSPQFTDVPVLDQCFIWSFNVRIPPGHAGYTGIALVDSGSWLVPYAQPGPAWLIGDDDDLTFPVLQQTGSTVQLAYYNTSTDFAHAWQVRVTYTPMSVMEVSSDAIVVPDITPYLPPIEANG